jgi:hypothetical protein
MFGYPLAYHGWVAFHAQMAQEKTLLTSSLTSTELSKQMLTGKIDAVFSSSLGALLTIRKVGPVCFAACLMNRNCAGYAPGCHKTSNFDLAELGGIECKLVLHHLKQLQNGRQPMLHFNLIQAPWDMRHAFVPM